LIYFGYPQAHEDDTERAVRAGLAVIEAVGRLPAREDLRVRLGIATGLAVVGDLIGAGGAQERGVVGETPNLAARLQALAAPDTLVIADNTRRQIGALFEIEDLGPQPLAGFAEPQRAWRVVSESGVLSRFEALRSEATPLIGREEELDLLLRRWQQAKAGEGRVVLVSGEPGIGKSRLTAALSQAPSEWISIRGCAISARHTIRTARSIRSSSSSNGPPGSRATTRPKKNSPSCGNCSRPVRTAKTKIRYWPSCCHCRVPPVTSTSALSASARCCTTRCCGNSKRWH
jgi:hypothetical protein